MMMMIGVMFFLFDCSCCELMVVNAWRLMGRFGNILLESLILRFYYPGNRLQGWLASRLAMLQNTITFIGEKENYKLQSSR